MKSWKTATTEEKRAWAEANDRDILLGRRWAREQKEREHERFEQSLRENGLKDVRVGQSHDGRNHPYIRRRGKPRRLEGMKSYYELVDAEGNALPPRVLTEGF